ncbi:MAG: TRAM domain-containing protein [Candidatus Binatia bacterium]
MAAPAAPDRLTLDVERLTYGPDALGHHGGQVVFVPQAAPGDRVEIEVVERHRSWLRGRVARVDAPGPARVLPGCAAFPRCGGCQWQHVAPTAQRMAKTAVVADQLARVAGLHDAPVLPTQPVGPDWGYRARIALVVEGRRLGYHRARSHVLVEVEDCPIAAPVVSAHLHLARAWAASVRVTLARVTIAEAPGGVVLVGDARATGAGRRRRDRGAARAPRHAPAARVDRRRDRRRRRRPARCASPSSRASTSSCRPTCSRR